MYRSRCKLWTRVSLPPFFNGTYSTTTYMYNQSRRRVNTVIKQNTRTFASQARESQHTVEHCTGQDVVTGQLLQNPVDSALGRVRKDGRFGTEAVDAP